MWCCCIDRVCAPADVPNRLDSWQHQIPLKKDLQNKHLANPGDERQEALTGSAENEISAR